MSRLNGKRILITGGGSGIGLAAARLCLNEGAFVAITGRNQTRLNEAVASLGGGDHLIAVPADLTDPTQAGQLIATVTERLGRIDILVNNAGVNIKEREFHQLTPDSWRTLVAGNLEAAFHCMHAVLPQMRERKDGLIINVNSISGKRANPLGGVAYIAAKFGLRGLAMGVGAEERSNNIRVTSIYPGEVNTPLLEARPEPVSEERKLAMLQPEDVAAAILFVATLPARAAIPEMVITPSNAQYI
ncbi:MAG: SDR family oxidoreductase [Gemmataceae bacterium]